MTTRFHRAVRQSLDAIADPKVKVNYERYFKGTLPFIGVRGPAVNVVFREHLPSLAEMPVDRVVDEAFGLLGSRFAEEKQIGILLLARQTRRLDDTFLPRLEPVFEQTVHEWATCDGLSGRVLRRLLVKSADARARIVGWSLAANQWRQRASAVAFVNEARRGEYNDEILTVCRRIVRNQERFVQLGAGWVVRELFLADREAALDFLRSHFAWISREGLRYAIEKMPPPLQRTLLDEHKHSQTRLAARRSRRA
jgi:3-methyladenine DNA glycosylase AlkD